MQRKINGATIRCSIVFAVIALSLALLSLRIYYIGQQEAFTQAAAEQRSFRVALAKTVGSVYDRHYKPLTNSETTFAAAAATPHDLSGYIDTLKIIAQDYAAVEEKLASGKPFAFTAIEAYDANGIMSFPVNMGTADLAVHAIGYLAETSGTGLQYAFRDILQKYSGELSVTYTVDAIGRMLEGIDPEVRDTTGNSVGGIVTTLDTGIQNAVERALEGKTGAVIVMDINGDIAALCSRPTYSPDELSSAVSDEKSPLLNRALECYNVGSVFKICVSAAALEAGVDDLVHECEGSINVYGREIGCHKADGHGLMNIQTALVNSCNPYFISLAQKVGSENIRSMAEKMSFGQEISIASGISSKSGILPTERELSPPVALANFSIGQGTLLASPLQVAVAVNCVASGGIRVAPRLVAGETADGTALIEEYARAEATRIFSVDTANAIKCNMEKVFSDGSVKEYAPKKYTAAGKTSTAQTGIVGEDGETICQTWLAGFYPSEKPKYTVVVLVEDGSSGAATAGPIFKEIIDHIGENCV